MRIFNLPDLGEGLQEAEIVEWMVSPGDHVVADQPLVSVETDKAVVEVPAPQSGTVTKLYGAVGDIIGVGKPLAAFAEGDEAAGRPDAGGIVGEIATSESPTPAHRRRAAPEPRKAHERKAASGRRPGGRGGVRATPAVRALARRLGVDLATVAPTGPEGAILSPDVERAAQTLESAGPLEPLRGPRRAMAQRMQRSHAEIAPATVMDDADIHRWRKGEDVTLRLVRAIAAACKAEPSLNAWFDSAVLARRLHERIDLGVAVDTPDGLFVPVLRDIGNRDRADLRKGLDRMKADVRARTIPAEELRGGTITLSNFGTIAGRYAAPVVVPPQVAILSAGVIAPQVVATAGKPAVHRLLPLSLTFDHRAVTGGEAARFLAALKVDLEKTR